jgi:hypothetical protein
VSLRVGMLVLHHLPTPCVVRCVLHRPVEDSEGHATLLVDAVTKKGTTVGAFAQACASAAKAAW